jgi:hypothetical protein
MYRKQLQTEDIRFFPQKMKKEEEEDIRGCNGTIRGWYYVVCHEQNFLL